MPIDLSTITPIAYDQNHPTRNSERFYGVLLSILQQMGANKNLVILPEERLNTYASLFGKLIECFRAGDFSLTVNASGIALTFPDGIRQVEATEDLKYNGQVIDLGMIKITLHGQTLSVSSP